MNAWNGLDFIIFLIFAANTLLGMARGTSREIISMMCLCMSLIITIRFTVPLAQFFNSSPMMVDVVSTPLIQRFMSAIGAGPLTEDLLKQIFYSISMLICFVGTFSICEAGLGRTNLVEVMSFPYATLNRKIGAGLGCTRGYVISLILLAILTQHIFRPGNNIGDGMTSNSFFASLFRSQTKQLDDLITQQNPDYYNVILDQNTFGPDQVFKILQPKETQVPAQQMRQLQGQQPQPTAPQQQAPAQQQTQPPAPSFQVPTN